MVHVYSVSSSSLTVQLYSRSRFLRLPLMNRLNIFTTDSPLSFCVYGTRTIKTPHQRASECHTERTPRSPKRPAAAHSATIVVQEEARAIVCLRSSKGLSLTPFTAATSAGGRVPVQTDVKVSQQASEAFCLGFRIISNAAFSNAAAFLTQLSA
ncbi:hypothetical protein GOODEAATRI_001739 [Goodea atripinnis]|uniref:Uncharacterized protein n=1 Tax=Goodea atripinnis TaxID=208336 RepID=A0ABV0NI85_9TELE